MHLSIIIIYVFSINNYWITEIYILWYFHKEDLIMESSSKHIRNSILLTRILILLIALIAIYIIINSVSIAKEFIDSRNITSISIQNQIILAADWVYWLCSITSPSIHYQSASRKYLERKCVYYRECKSIKTCKCLLFVRKCPCFYTCSDLV